MFFGRVYGLSPRQVKEKTPAILRRLGLEWERALEPMSHLSRGQQQKVAVARAFLTSPVLMLLDEPTTGLDPRSKRDVQAFIRRGAGGPRRDDPADDARHGGGRAALRPHLLHLGRQDRRGGHAAGAAAAGRGEPPARDASTWRRVHGADRPRPRGGRGAEEMEVAVRGSIRAEQSSRR